MAIMRLRGPRAPIRIATALGALLMILSIGAAYAAPYTPSPGTSTRRAIMNALRVPVQRSLNQRVVFLVRHLRVNGSWAFMVGDPREPDGDRIDYTNTHFADEVYNGEFGCGIYALLHREYGRWRVTRYYIGPTEPVYTNWIGRFGAPRNIFPYYSMPACATGFEIRRE